MNNWCNLMSLSFFLTWLTFCLFITPNFSSFTVIINIVSRLIFQMMCHCHHAKLQLDKNSITGRCEFSLRYCAVVHWLDKGEEWCHAIWWGFCSNFVLWPGLISPMPNFCILTNCSFSDRPFLDRVQHTNKLYLLRI